MNKEKYKRTVALLLEILPFVLKDERFALKGGTAINLFHRDFLRHSVDIDICYLPLEDRSTTFRNIHGILARIKLDLESKLGLKVNVSNPLDIKKESKIIATRNNIQVKIEPNFILRSCLFPVQNIGLAKKASLEFQKSVEARCLSFQEFMSVIQEPGMHVFAISAIDVKFAIFILRKYMVNWGRTSFMFII